MTEPRLNPRQRRRQAEARHAASRQAGRPVYTTPLHLDRLEAIVRGYTATSRQHVRRHLGRMRKPGELER